jgi:hypothetical protein
MIGQQGEEKRARPESTERLIKRQVGFTARGELVEPKAQTQIAVILLQVQKPSTARTKFIRVRIN